MTTICLVRHGETDWNSLGRLQGREDIPLNERGREQADLVGRFLEKEPFTAIYTSPLLRAKQTAETINRYLGGLPLNVTSDFIEKDYGEASGMTVAERDAHFPDGKIPGMEFFNQIEQRVRHGLSEIEQAHPADQVLLVAHGGLINVILSVFSHGKYGTGKTKLFNTCISHIRSNGNSWEIIDFNCIDHLSAFGKVTSI
ncbi:MAG: histidine phosphatase family protein [Sporolactobacillus sp.]